MEVYAQNFENIVRNKGGQVLTPYKGRFKPIELRCKNKHEWETTPAVILQGSWCKSCADIERLEIAKQGFLEKINPLNYTLLSNYEKSTKHVKLRCSNNHTFRITPKYFNVLVKQKKEPCAKCRKNSEEIFIQ